MEAAEQEGEAALWALVGRDIETLQSSPDRGARRAALLRLKGALLADDTSTDDKKAPIVAAFFARRLQAPLLAVVGGDAAEACRELGAALLLALCERPGFLSHAAAAASQAPSEGLLAAYLPVVRRRVAAPAKEGEWGREVSEEVRLLLLRVLNALLANPRCWPLTLRQPVRAGDGGGPFVDLAVVLARCVHHYHHHCRCCCSSIAFAFN